MMAEKLTTKSSGNVTIVTAEGTEFAVDGSSLAQESRYFQGLLESGMRETRAESITLPVVTSRGMMVISSYLVVLDGSCLTSCLDHIDEILVAVNYLQMPKLLEFCVDFIRTHITVEQCYYFWELGRNLMIPTIEELAENSLKNNFEDFVQKTDHLTNMTKTEVVSYLGSDFLNCKSEISVFNASVRWLKSNVGDVSEHECVQIISCTRFGHLTSKELEDCLYICQKNSLSTECKDIIREVITSLENPTLLKPEHQNLHRMRKGNTISVAVATGGFTRKGEKSSRLFQTFPLESLPLHTPNNACSPDNRPSRPKRRQKLAREVAVRLEPRAKLRLPGSLCEHCTCAVNNYMYVAGGQSKYQVSGKFTQSTVWRFNPRDASWRQVCSMQQPRSLFCLLEVRGFMYAVCGWKAPNTVNKSVERYDPGTDRWEYMAPNHIGLHEHAGCTLGGVLYISGGYKGPNRGHLDKIWRYDPERDEWEALAPMFHARSYHAMLSLTSQDKVLVVGGVCNTDSADTFEDLQNCELYDPSTNQWTTICTIPNPATCMPSLVINDVIYLFGSYCFQESRGSHELLQILDTRTWTWSTRQLESHDIQFFGLSTLDIPLKFL